jgi:hypothetical protein
MISSRSFLVFAVVGVVVRSAGASPESDKLFRDGRELLNAGKIPEACEAFAASMKLEARVGTLLNLADCREKQGQTATAWQLFLEAKQLAAAQRDRRQAEADRRALAIQAKLSFLTITVAPDRQVDGLVIKRNGVAVDRALWNTAVAVDPGDHVIEASAPGFRPWSAVQTIGGKQKVTVVVEALAAEPIAGSRVEPGGSVAGPANAVERPLVTGVARLPSPPLRLFSVGPVVGATTDDDTVFGGRATGGISVPRGALRGIVSLLYTSYQDDLDDSDTNTRLFALGVSADYVWMPVPKLAFAAGLGVGMDREVRNLDRGSDSTGWWTLRASPVIVRLLDGHLEAGLHVQYVGTSDRGVVLGLAAIDLFPL